MKLNTKRTIYVGFAFFLILAFWQAYDSIIPLILTNKFGMSQFWSGAIMALDNILALFLLPLVWGVDGIFAAIIAAEIMALLLTIVFLVAKRKKYGYFG